MWFHNSGSSIRAFTSRVDGVFDQNGERGHVFVAMSKDKKFLMAFGGREWKAYADAVGNAASASKPAIYGDIPIGNHNDCRVLVERKMAKDGTPLLFTFFIGRCRGSNRTEPPRSEEPCPEIGFKANNGDTCYDIFVVDGEHSDIANFSEMISAEENVPTVHVKSQP
jgi:hypothetical protein